MEHLSKTKLIVLALAFTVCATVPASAQVSYLYDAAGNRTAKTVMLAKTSKKMARLDTAEADEMVAFAAELSEPQCDAVGHAEIKIYPNPTKGALRVDIAGVELSDDDRIDVFDSNGQLVKACVNLTEINQIDISNAIDGMYYMRMTIGGESTTWRIIKE